MGESGQVALTPVEHRLGRPARPAPAAESMVLRYPRRLRPRLRAGHAAQGRARPPQGRLRTPAPPAADLPRPVRRGTLRPPGRPAPRPGDPGAARFLPEFDNLLLSHADRARVVIETSASRPGLSGRRHPGAAHDRFGDVVRR
ncbi:winged helix DNA-binding domain-containing protein [Streptomyces tricolor]|nr:winged helix DNA-binding domain-containing protein [Streptomyces tricolor]